LLVYYYLWILLDEVQSNRLGRECTSMKYKLLTLNCNDQGSVSATSRNQNLVFSFRLLPR
jgi:hypothetical protein